jgi:hypothetical protein
LIAFPCSEGTAESTRIFIQLEYNDYTNHINDKKMSSCLIASTSAIISRSLKRSRFKIAFDYYSHLQKELMHPLELE